ncbi:MAG: TlpA family protein disulfide reductase [Xanthomonadaceae bacterium]|jgi:thiol-disulfide isomerase/thioredoxin|nr:TlpA family protein disulfide reductase [Xanthomonadaceae bacterium]
MKTMIVALCLSWLLVACQRDGTSGSGTGDDGKFADTATERLDRRNDGARLEDIGMEFASFPELKQTTLDGGEFDLSAYRGKWVVVNFWATWCTPCLREIGELSALQRDDARIEVVGVAYEETTPERMRAFLRDHPADYPVILVDPGRRPGDFPAPAGLPVSYLLAPDGRVTRRFLGAVTAAMIQNTIEEMEERSADRRDDGSS